MRPAVLGVDDVFGSLLVSPLDTIAPNIVLEGAGLAILPLSDLAARHANGTLPEKVVVYGLWPMSRRDVELVRRLLDRERIAVSIPADDIRAYETILGVKARYALLYIAEDLWAEFARLYGLEGVDILDQLADLHAYHLASLRLLVRGYMVGALWEGMKNPGTLGELLGVMMAIGDELANIILDVTPYRDYLPDSVAGACTAAIGSINSRILSQLTLDPVRGITRNLEPVSPGAHTSLVECMRALHPRAFTSDGRVHRLF